ncbi:polyprenyl synthetase family protein [Aquibacillus kalidii]|uniref:polyprenyl synthetase family protein n=1 Tax=Aquibacillus kalidii TaxID=2762597 RepID=UPI001648BA72|nr:polyprenyl synthetase family protein [Aquibacillus kalidii]
MNNKLKHSPEDYYYLEEQKAAHYFESLQKQVVQHDYIPSLTKAIEAWRKKHVRRFSLTSLFSSIGKPDGEQYEHYMKWLDRTGSLEKYLERSFLYIFMRDLGKDPDSKETHDKVNRVVENIRDSFHSSSSDGEDQPDLFRINGLYRLAQQEGIESALIWVMEKLKVVSSNIPEGMDAVHAERKLIKLIAGVVMHVLDEMGEEVSREERTQRLDEAIRLGYYYGLTYPFIDDLLDASVLSPKEKHQYSDMIRTTLVTGTVPSLKGWTGKNKELVTYIHSELYEAFEYIKNYQHAESVDIFFKQSYLFFQSQEVDRLKDISNPDYTNEELFIPIILKSSSSRMIVRSVISASENKDIEDRTFYYGIYNQLADDFADMFEDLEAEAVTPYTYYMKYHNQRQDLINPFELYWTVISHLIEQVYHSSEHAVEVMLNRAINGLKRFKEKNGVKTYNQVMALFAPKNAKFNRLIQQMVHKANDVDFFDKLLRTNIITSLERDRQERDEFIESVRTVRDHINSLLFIPKKDQDSLMGEPIVAAANYSLQGDGKRLRPIITWSMGVNTYGLSKSAITPLLKSLEYMHTASLIFDDLPSQDNAPVRRGRQTLHEMYNIATAELAGLFLTQKAYEEQASLDDFEPKVVLRLIKYSSQITAEMCRGQAVDLDSEGKVLTLEQLNQMCFYKTGIGFEASLVMPAILANVGDTEIESLKAFAYHAGIAFQIKDDLLDVEGDTDVLGKQVGRDLANSRSTFVSILGMEGAKKAMWEQYCLALESLQKIPHDTPFLKQLMNYIIHRNH